jgi:hypothetical protein
LADAARAETATTLLASFLPSAKNAPAATFLPDHHFQSLGENRWRIDLADVPGVCSSITLLRTDAGPVSGRAA